MEPARPPILLLSLALALAASAQSGALTAQSGSAAAPALAASYVDRDFESLIARAAPLWSRGQTLKPGSMRIRSEELDKKGSLVSVEETELALSYPEGPDAPRTEILRASKDGKDVTAQRREEAAKRRGGSGGGPPGGMDFPDPVPFAAGAEGKLRSGAPRPAEGSGLREYSYEISGKSAVVGRIRFDSEGLPHSLDYGLKPLPFYLDSFAGRTRFSKAPDGSLVASELWFDAEANLLVFRKRYRITMSFGDWLRPAPGPAAKK